MSLKMQQDGSSQLIHLLILTEGARSRRSVVNLSRLWDCRQCEFQPQCNRQICIMSPTSSIVVRLAGVLHRGATRCAMPAPRCAAAAPYRVASSRDLGEALYSSPVYT
ncbi:hypothetical protein J6590_007865 [Homalodisca vitripennis]|nr:hypothetical protein J6590_007865 [Homalodisca vitripennis]